MTKLTISIEQIDAFVFDFDGVLTNNLVHLDHNGNELVSCNRGDGLGFDVLHKINKPTYILSTEKNPVVTARANKLKIPAIQGVKDKVAALQNLANEKNYNLNRVLYIGNDINDYNVMQLCGYPVCPGDSHTKIKEIASIVLKTSGGCGVVRELLEDVLELNFLEILYS